MPENDGKVSPVRVTLLITVVFLICGPLTGIQGIFAALAKRGVFSDKCHGTSSSTDHHDGVTAAPSSPHKSSSSFQCPAQEHAIASMGNAEASLMNAVAMPAGIAVDVFDPYYVAIVGGVFWVMGIAVCGIQVSNGIAMTTGVIVAAWGASFLFLPLAVYHARLSVGGTNMKALGVVLAAFTGCWDFGSVVMYFIALLLDNTSEEAFPLWALFIIYAAIGVAGTLGLAVYFTAAPADPAQEKVEQSCGRKIIETIKQYGRDIKRFLVKPEFWVVNAKALTVVGLGYVLLDNIGPLVRYRDKGSNEHVPEMLRNITLMMGGSALFTFIPGRLQHKFGPIKGSAIVAMLSPVMLIVGALFAVTINASPEGKEYQNNYGAYFFFLMWRVISFSIISITINMVICKDGKGVGTAFGSVFSFAGLVCVPIGQYITNELQKASTDTNAADTELSSAGKNKVEAIIWGMVGFSILVDIFLSYTLLRLHGAEEESTTPADQVDNDEENVAKVQIESGSSSCNNNDNGPSSKKNKKIDGDDDVEPTEKTSLIQA